MDSKTNINILRKIEFLASYPNIKTMAKNLANDQEIAFIGRSNSGKSTLLNTLCEQSSLAKSGKTPGLTRAINVFGFAPISEKQNPAAKTINTRIIDLPGYGYAKISQESALSIAKTLIEYLQKSKVLQTVVMLIDSRRGLLKLDIEVLKLLPANIELIIALSKVDKLKQNELITTEKKVAQQFADYFSATSTTIQDFQIFPVSCTKTHKKGNIGINNLKTLLNTKFN